MRPNVTTAVLRIPRHTLLLPVFVALAGCASVGMPRAPGGAIDGIPWRGGAFDDLVVEARLANDRGDRARARALLDQVFSETSNHVDAKRLRQDMLRAAGRHGLVLAEARASVEENPDDAGAWYLLGRAESDVDQRRRAFEKSIELDGQGFFGWLGLAFLESRSDPVRAEEVFLALGRASDGHPLVDHNLAVLYGSAGDHERALASWANLAERELEPGRSALGRAEALIALDRPAEAFQATVDALRKRPFDPAVKRLVEVLSAASLPEPAIEELVDLLLAEPGLREAFFRAGGIGVYLDLLRRAGNGAAAREALLAEGSVEDREYRLALLDAGAVNAYLDALDRFVPRILRNAEDNQVRGLWSRVLDGPYREIDVLGDPDELVGLASALADCGLLDEAERLLTTGLIGADPQRFHPAIALRDRLRRELAFIHSLRRRLYGSLEAQDGGSLDALLQTLRDDSRQILGVDIVGSPRRFEVPFAGALLDPFGPGLCQWFRDRNLHLLLGARAGGAPDGFLVTRVSVRDLDRDGPLPLRGPATEVLGDAREIRSLRAVLGGDLAGVALLNHYVIDLGAIRDWASELVRERERVRETTTDPLSDPLPFVEDPLDPLDARIRWNFACPLADEDLFLAVLDIVRWHERAHLADVFHYLPIGQRLPRILGLLFGQGFSPAGVESEFECRAEAIALAYSAYPSLVLAHIADFVPRRNSASSHARGFAQLARWLNAALDSSAGPDAEPAAVSRWIQREPAELRRAARSIATRLGS